MDWGNEEEEGEGEGEVRWKVREWTGNDWDAMEEEEGTLEELLAPISLQAEMHNRGKEEEGPGVSGIGDGKHDEDDDNIFEENHLKGEENDEREAWREEEDSKREMRRQRFFPNQSSSTNTSNFFVSSHMRGRKNEEREREREKGRKREIC